MTRLPRSSGASTIFEHRFGRKPEGMWLPETAVDLETLDILAQHGIRFTILSPYQAGKVRKHGGRNWVDAAGGQIDPTTPYEQRLPSGRRIVVFFYDGPISRALAFEQLLRAVKTLQTACTGHFPMIANGRSWYTWRPTANHTVIIIRMAIWRWPMPCTASARMDRYD